ncbi:hypothetical protein ACFL2F_05450, partial [Myxococcota bacterium]
QLDARNCDDADACTTDACEEDNDRCTNTMVPNPGAEGPQGDTTCSNNLDDDCDGQTDLDDSDCVDCQSANDCDDANSCTLDDCQAGGCTNTPQVGQGCDDTDDCTHTDVCNGAGQCRGTTIACVDDPPPCGVVRNCDGTDTCEEIYPGSGVSCDDTDSCTHTDRCDGSGSCAGTLITCQDDPPPCGMVRTCDGTAACDESYPGSATSCDDTDPCTYNDACSGSGDCVGTDNTFCTNGPAPCGIIRSCNGTAGCDESYPDSSTVCEDGLFCTMGDRCDGAGGCPGGSVSPCGIGETCWEDEDQCCEDDVAQVCGANDNDVHHMDSCGHEGGVYQNCPDPNGECVGAACQCRPHWTGQFCDACEDGWVGQDCEVCVRYVNKNAGSGGTGLTWADAFVDVQSGINEAYQETQQAGGPEVCEVWVVTGTYYIYVNGRSDTVQLMPGVEVYGGFTATEDARDQRDWKRQITVLNGWDQPHTNRVTNVVTGADKAAIDGFVIYGGNAAGAAGGGMLNNMVSPRVENCVFLENIGQTGGGMANFDCSPIVKNCHFTRNGGTWGGGMNSTEASPFIDSCIFAGNNASYGGGLRSEDSGGYINNSIFIGNWVVQGAASMIITAETVANCTSTRNSPGSVGNSIGLLGSPQFRNCILWDTAAGDQTNHLAQADVQYSDVYVDNSSVLDGDG